MHTVTADSNWFVRLAARLSRHARPAPALVPGPPDATGHVEVLLSQMRPGERGHLLSLCTCCAARQHLLELGFTPGTEVEFVRRAPLGDPLTVRIRGYQLSLRRQEAEAVRVRRCPPDFGDDRPGDDGRGE